MKTPRRGRSPLSLDPPLVMEERAWEAAELAYETYAAHADGEPPTGPPRRPRPDIGFDRPLYQMCGDIAVLQVCGVVRYEATFLGELGIVKECSTRVLLLAIDEVKKDPAAKGVLFHINSGGGEGTGVPECAWAIRALGEVKPTIAYAMGPMGSAAYWLGSQAKKVYAAPNAEVGSIGTFWPLIDASHAAWEAGYQVKVVRSAKYKGLGVLGERERDVEVGDKELRVAALTDVFYDHVTQARGLKTQVLSGLEARMLPAKAALEVGLIDGILPLSKVLGDLQAEIAPPPPLDPTVVVVVDPEPVSPEVSNAETPRKESHMEKVEVEALIAAAVNPLAQENTALKTEIEQMKVGNAETKAKADELARADRKRALIAKGDADNKFPKLGPGRVSALKMVDTAWEQGEAFAAGYVDGLPVLGKRDGSVLRGTGPASTASGSSTGSPSAAAPVVRHRFDHFGPEVWSVSDDPQMVAFGERITWIAAQEAAGNKFSNSAEAFKQAAKATGKA